MRVLFWSDLYWPYIGGAEVFAAKLMASLRARGVEFLVVTSHHDRDLPDDDEYQGIPVKRLPFRAAIGGRDVKAFLGAMSRVSAIKREFAPDLIHMNAIGPSALFHVKTAGSSNAPLIVTLQQEVLASQADGASTLMAQIIESASRVVACSGTVLEQLRAAHPAVVERSTCIYNGIDMPAVEPAPLPATPNILCLGRLVPAKGFDVALRAFATLAERHPDVRFTIAGDGASRDELVSLADSLGIGGRVAFTGWVEPERVPEFLNDAYAVVMPSRREGMPIVGAQAALMARPLVATAAGGLREIVIDGETGLVIAPEDPEAIVVAIERLLADRDLASALGARARRHCAELLDWERIVSAYHAVYIA